VDAGVRGPADHESGSGDFDVVAALAAVVEGWSPSGDRAELVEVWALVDRLAAKAHRAMGEVDVEGGWELDGATSMVAWLGHELGMVAGRAKRAAVTGRRLRAWPATAEAWEAGALSGGQVEAVVANVPPYAVERFAGGEEAIVADLSLLDVHDTTAVMQAWRAHAEALDAASGEGAGRRRRRSWLCHSRTLDGWHRFDGDFDPEAGAIIDLALQAAMTPDVGGEPRRDRPERVAGALADICRLFLDSPGLRPHPAGPEATSEATDETARKATGEAVAFADGDGDGDDDDRGAHGPDRVGQASGGDGGPAGEGRVGGGGRSRPHLHVLCDLTVIHPHLRTPDPTGAPGGPRGPDLAGLPGGPRAPDLAGVPGGPRAPDRTRVPGGSPLPDAARLVDRYYAAAGCARLLDGTPLDAQTTQRLLCDAAVHRVITNGRATILDHGRATRTITPALYRALLIRDRGCRWPGCHRPPQWCEGHHVIAWNHQGPTRLDNLVLLCTRHHHLTHGQAGHPQGWQLKLHPDGTLETTSPTGRTRHSRPPP
jgi:hypothetical protein